MARYSLRLPLLLYGGSLALIALDLRPLPRLIDGYGGLELEYRPVEQATRLAYLVGALVLRGFGDFIFPLRHFCKLGPDSGSGHQLEADSSFIDEARQAPGRPANRCRFPTS